MATYKPYKKTESGKEEIKIPYRVLSNPPDLSAYAKLAGGNTFTGKQTLNSPASDGYSINAAGYVKGSRLQAPSTGHAGSGTGKICVLDGSGWIYYRTPAEILTEAGGAKASDIPNDYVKYTAQTLTDAQKSQARSNIGAGTSNFDGTWGSLSGKPDIVQSTGASTSSVMSQNATTNAISGKLDKTAYEVNKTIEFGRDGALYIGKFKVYDTNVTFEITSTTSVTYSGKLVIATQNYVIAQMTVYGDAANTVAPNFFVKPSTTSNPYIEVYFKPSSWSKNVVHIYGSNIQAEPTDVCTNVPSVPSTATLKPKNALPTYSLSGTTLTITL